jgi:single-strand DNA-binding protein
MNNCVFIGNLASDVELQKFGEGDKSVSKASFRLAVPRDFKNKNGEREADFINIVAWGKNAEHVSGSLVKGDRVSIESKVVVNTVKKKDEKTGEDKSFTFVDFQLEKVGFEKVKKYSKNTAE